MNERYELPGEHEEFNELVISEDGASLEGPERELMDFGRSYSLAKAVYSEIGHEVGYQEEELTEDFPENPDWFLEIKLGEDKESQWWKPYG